ncbi:Uncharacterised protein [Mycobacterium tuberculosis]|nr:Uncharacterised protein [Mycobacterium tuberculosis]CKT64466.1 Uncharacterised protein [Mycobacterium tuberculosis]
MIPLRPPGLARRCWCVPQTAQRRWAAQPTCPPRPARSCPVRCRYLGRRVRCRLLRSAQCHPRHQRKIRCRSRWVRRPRPGSLDQHRWLRRPGCRVGRNPWWHHPLQCRPTANSSVPSRRRCQRRRGLPGEPRRPQAGQSVAVDATGARFAPATGSPGGWATQTARQNAESPASPGSHEIPPCDTVRRRTRGSLDSCEAHPAGGGRRDARCVVRLSASDRKRGHLGVDVGRGNTIVLSAGITCRGPACAGGRPTQGHRRPASGSRQHRRPQQ